MTPKISTMQKACRHQRRCDHVLVGVPVLVGPRWSELWESWIYVEESGSSWKPPGLRSERDPHPAGLRSVALSNHRPESKSSRRISRSSSSDSRQIGLRHRRAPYLYDVVPAVFAMQSLHSTDIQASEDVRACIHPHSVSTVTWKRLEMHRRSFFF